MNGSRPPDKLTDGFAGDHGDGEGEVDRARAGRHRDGQARLGDLVDLVGDARRFAAEKQYIGGTWRRSAAISR